MTFEELARLTAPRTTPDRGLVKDGGTLPKRGATEDPVADALYDALSEILRSRPRHVGEAYQVIREADRLLSVLDTHLREGGTLPSPWRRCGRARHSAP